MENDLEILQNIIQNEYNNNKNIQFGDIRITTGQNNKDLYFYYPMLPDKQENKRNVKAALYKIDTILELIVGKMHSDHIICNAAYVDLANAIYEPIYNLYKEYIRERNYYV